MIGCLKARWLAALAALHVGVAAAQQPLSPDGNPVVAAPAAPVTTAGASASSADRPLTAEDVEPWLDGFMPSALHRADIAGAVVTVVKDGQVVVARGYGWADIAHRNRVDPKLTLFRPGSVSKLVT
jgi:CubicO group peptidase (beta-lactamase class C family)